MRSRSILLVEDDENDVFFIKDALERVGVDLPLHVASDGQEAIDFLIAARAPLEGTSDVHPVLVLLDLNLPRRTGLEVLKWIRQESAWPWLVVVILTSSTSELDMRQAYSLGANSYVVKPADATKLRELVKYLQGYWLGWNQSPRS
jgi:CheY-like chemotaxis protein